FYRDVLGLAIYRQFGPPEHPGTVFFLGQGLLEVSGQSDPMPAGGGPAGAAAAGPVQLWLQVRDLVREHSRLVEAGVTVTRAPQREPWGLDEMWIADPDGIAIVVVEIPADHPLRRDQR
nr:VOC family protein [Micromonospora sp. DSM 115978]